MEVIMCGILVTIAGLMIYGEGFYVYHDMYPTQQTILAKKAQNTCNKRCLPNAALSLINGKCFCRNDYREAE